MIDEVEDFMARNGAAMAQQALVSRVSAILESVDTAALLAGAEFRAEVLAMGVSQVLLDERLSDAAREAVGTAMRQLGYPVAGDG